LPELSSAGRLALKSLTGRAISKTLDLALLESGLIRLGVGADLPAALAALGHPVSGEQASRRAERAKRKEAREAARALSREWPEPWASRWMDEVIRAGILRGLHLEQAQSFLGRIRLVLDHLDHNHPAPMSRVDLAAQVLGDSHALDSGTRIEAAVARALAFKLGPASTQELWAQAGVHLDLTSAPALTWGLPLTQDSGLAALSCAALAAGVPVHLSRFALQQHPLHVPPGTRLLVVENPRVVEAAAQIGAAAAIISTNGWPGSAVLLLLRQLLDAGAVLAYHGDFDTAGLAICERMMRLGLTPWRMDASDYRAALQAADAAGATLPRERQPPGPTPWDPALRPLLDQERRVLHEERLLPGLIEAAGGL